jgi:hypothetical protein
MNDPYKVKLAGHPDCCSPDAAAHRPSVERRYCAAATGTPPRSISAVALAAIAGVVAMFLPPVVATEVSWAAAKGDD